jgi:sarcosine oxidase subunit beta
MREIQTADTVVVGGGVMGCTVAFRLAEKGQRVVLLERGGLCMQASGVNAGTLSIQIKRAVLVPYAMRGWDLWRTTREWLGEDVGFEQVGGITLAFTEEEAELLTERMAARQEQGAPIEIVDPGRARELEPGLSDKPVLASWCPMDGYASSYRLGNAFRSALRRVGVAVHEFTSVGGLERKSRGYVVRTDAFAVRAPCVVLAAGVWLEQLLARDFGVHIPVECRVNQVSVTERMPPIMRRVLGIATGLLTLKQSRNGTVLIGGGWQGKGDPDRGGYEIIPENLIGNLRLAAYAIPALREARIVRTWLGVEGKVEDVLPLVGEIPGAPDAYVIGCVRGGFTIGPFMGTLLAQRIVGNEPEMPLFDPARTVVPPGMERNSVQRLETVQGV